MKTILISFALLLLAASTAMADVRIKDITQVSGVRKNKLTGIGLVVGLNGTGGKSPITRQYVANLLERFGQRNDPFVRERLRTDTQLRTDNASVVVVTAELPIFARPGSRIDVTVAAFDDAKSLQGGELLSTTLKGVDGEVYALAAGPVILGGFSASGDAASVQQNHPTAGRVPNGAIVEETVPYDFAGCESFQLLLHQADFETAKRIVDAVNVAFPETAAAEDAGTVRLLVPPDAQANPVGFLGTVGQLRITPDVAARVVINERTGTVIIGQDVKISKAAITHANLTVITAESPQVSQPAPFSDGETTVVPRTEINVLEDRKPVTVFEETATVGELAQALNALGATPRDLSSIFQQLKEAGALHAELEFR